MNTNEVRGAIRVRNPSACWLPDLTLTKRIGGAVYTVSGSYDGTALLDQKLKRIMAQNLKPEEENE